MDSPTVIKTLKDIWIDEADIEHKILAIDEMTGNKSIEKKLTKADLVEVIKWMLEFCVN